MDIKGFLTAIAVSLLLATGLQSAPVTQLAWTHAGEDVNGNPTTLIGFNFNCSYEGGAEYTVTLPDGAARTFPLSGVATQGDGKYVCDMSAVNDIAESGRSNTVTFFTKSGTYQIPGAPAAPFGLRIE